MTDKPATVALPQFNIKKAAALGTPKSILIYGPPKKGKTVFASSIVECTGYERTLLVDVEGGSTSVNAWYPQVDVIEAATARDFQKIIEALLNGKLVEPESGLPYQAVIIDTLDKAQERQLEVFAASPEAKNKQGDENTFYKWGALKTWTSKVTDHLHMAPFLTIFLAHQDEDKDENTGKVTTTVMLSGKSKLTFPGTPDVVGHFTVANVTEDGKKVPHRIVDFTVQEKLITGQRFADKLNGKFLDPTMSVVFNKINGK